MDEQNNHVPQRKALEERIKEIDEQIALLNTIKNQSLAKLQSLPQITAQQPNPVINSQTQTSADKIALFKSYFRGRDDVYAKLWINNKTGKKGYSPACKHEWDQALCRKPNIKCSECPNQGFLQPDETAIRQHLTGAQVMGIYPMLKNESCYFLAMDFDKEHWLDDVRAIMQTCHEEGVTAAVERSRSGNGGHVWIFFSEEVPALLARRLGSFLITQSMSQRYQMDMKSYDRLFPSQDTLPKGGFGNLIALPFQKEAITRGNSLFIDRSGKPYTDQWQFLASVKKMSYKEVESMGEQAVKKDQVIAARPSPVEENDEPWMRLPSGKKRFKVDVKDMPQSIEVVLANRIYIKIGQGSPVLYNQLKHLAAFQNPEFYKKQRMRFSTYDTPRVICCAEIVDGYLSLPRGCLEDAQALLKEYDIKLNMEDKRITGNETNFDFDGTLSLQQEEALKGILDVDFGVFVAPPGTGKTVLAIAAIAKRKTNVLSMLWVDEKHVLFQDDFGKMLRQHRDIFTAKTIYQSFTGYAYSQLKRMTHFQFEGYMGEKRKTLVEHFGYDTKNAAHLIRLLRMGIEFLQEGILHVTRPDAQELLAIKKGEWTLERVKKEAERLFKEAEEKFVNSKLPDVVDEKYVEKFLVDMIKKYKVY